jgi:prepilin-type N-terminal cleavage/methylation domain-containing protein
MSEYPSRRDRGALARAARRRRNRPGFSLLEIMVVVAIFSILMAIAIPNWVRARTMSQARACAHNLRTIQSAKEQYAMINKLPAGSTVTFAQLIAGQYLRVTPICPEGFNYTIGTIDQDPICQSGQPDHVVNP